MRCDEFERRMQQLLDQRKPPAFDSQLQAHALTCTACHEVLDAQAMLFEVLDFGVDEQPTPQFESEIVQRVITAHNTPPSTWRGVWLTVGTLAAALLLMIALVRGSGSVIAVPESPLVMVPDALQVASSAGGVFDEIDVPNSGDDFAALYQILDGIPPQSLHSVDQLAGGLRPIANSFSAAFDALRRTFPIGDPALEIPPTSTKRLAPLADKWS